MGLAYRKISVERVRASLRYRARKLGKSGVPLFRDADAMSLWQRQVMNESVLAMLTSLGPAKSGAIEISGDLWHDLPWASYRSTSYPEFDLVDASDDFDAWEIADIVICEQVLEHVSDPIMAMRNLVRLVKPGGTVIVSTPFLVRLHPHPNDYWRFTPQGLEALMNTGGLERIQVESWGNRRCIKANFRRWTPMKPWHSRANEPEFPIQVWASGVRPLGSP
jgi:SAM-dependent methyltransferase